MLVLSAVARWDPVPPRTNSLGRDVADYQFVWPQAWSFFIGVADNDVLVAYRINANGVVSTRQNQQATWQRPLGGLDRSSDSESVEIGQIAALTPDRYWQARCAGQVAADCTPRTDQQDRFALANPTASASICGLTAVFDERRETQALNEIPKDPQVVYRVAVVDVSCRG